MPATRPARARVPKKPSSTRQRRRPQAPRRPALPTVRKEMLISHDVGEQRVAILEDGQPVEVYLERPGRRSIAGNVYKGVVDNVLPGMEASFVDIGLEKDGFLYVDEIVVPELEGKRKDRRIQDLISKGQEVIVQAVKDPMGTKGARLTTEVSLPGRFLVYTPFGDGIGVSRRLEDEERERLKAICRSLELEEGGVIVRTAAEGASEEELAADLALLVKLWATIQGRATRAKAPALVYAEAELPLRVVRDLFRSDFDRLAIDHERTYRRIVSYLRRTSRELADRVERYREDEPIMERFGVEAAVRSTLERRVDLPSGGYLIFDYAEAFTVIDVNTGRFVGARGKGAAGRLEETITKNNLEAAKEIVRQLRLRDIGGIIVIDFIDMANPKNRHDVEEALKLELERDRTKTYVVEISPLGLVEMTRQNVTDGPREILTKRCPVCEGNGILVSEETHAVEAERRLRRLVASSAAEAFIVELPTEVARILIGPAGSRLAEIERETGRRFAFETRDDLPAGPPEPSSQKDRRRRSSQRRFPWRRARSSTCSSRRYTATIRTMRSHGSTDTSWPWPMQLLSSARPYASESDGQPGPSAMRLLRARSRSRGLSRSASSPRRTTVPSRRRRRRTRRGTRGGRGRAKPGAGDATEPADQDGEVRGGAGGARWEGRACCEGRAPANGSTGIQQRSGAQEGRPGRSPPRRSRKPRRSGRRRSPEDLGLDGVTDEPTAEAAPKRKTRRGTRGGRGRKRPSAAAQPADNGLVEPETADHGDAAPPVSPAPSRPRCQRERRSARGAAPSKANAPRHARWQGSSQDACGDG